MAPNEQIIDLVVSSSLRSSLGINVGAMYKMKVKNSDNNISYYIRSRIVHSFKAGPGFDILPELAFITPQQANYLYEILD